MESKLFRLRRIKAQLWRLFPVIFLFISLVLILFTQKGTGTFSEKVKQGTINIFAPVISVISKPVDWTEKGIDYVKNWSKTYYENERLKKENEYLIQWRSLALQLSEEQKELKAYLNYVSSPEARHIVAKIALDEGSAFTRSFVVSAGSEQGVSKGMLAFSPKGMFGRVVEVMPHYAKIMALTDSLSRVPVWVGENKVSALLLGDNTARPVLQFLNENDVVQKGDVVMTSGYVGVYPSGLVIGMVDEVEEGEVRVLSFENGEHLSFVRLVDFAISGPLLKEEE